jgi:hypothetical protein
MSVLLLTAAALPALLGWARAVHRCRTQIAQGKAAARRRADVALAVERHRMNWDADTGRLATALQPLTTPTAPRPATGFGDALVADEQYRLALHTLTPTEEPIPW